MLVRACGRRGDEATRRCPAGPRARLILGVFCSAAATAIDCHIDRGQSKAAGFFFCFSSINVTFACAVGTLLEQHLLAFIHTKLSTPSLLGCLKATTPRKRRVDAPDDDARRDVDASSWELELLR